MIHDTVRDKAKCVVTILTIVFQPIRRELGSLADNISQYTISEGLVSKILLDFRSYCDFRGMRAYPTTVEHFFPSYRYFPSGRFFFFLRGRGHQISNSSYTSLLHWNQEKAPN